MKPAELLTMIEASGARLTLTAAGRLRITGEHAERWLATIAQYEAELVQALKASAGTAAGG